MDTEQNQQLFVIAASEGIERLVSSLDLSRFIEAGLQINEAKVLGGRIRLDFTWDGVGDEVVILRRADDQPSFLRTSRLSLSVGGSSVSRPYQVLLSRIALSAGNMDIDDFILKLAGPQIPENSADEKSPINSWSIEDAWSMFTCDHAMARKFYEALQFEDNSSVLVHGDLECKFITPRFRATLPRFFNYPWKLFGDSEGSDPLTNVTDSDVINGGEQTLADHIEIMLSGLRRSGPVIINSTCVPVVIGDDVEKVMAPFKSRCADGMYHLSPVTKDPREIMMRYLDDARDKALRESDPKPGSIGLVGFRSGRTHHELLSLIESCGITVEGTILPKASSRLMERVMKADVLVFRPSVFMTELYERVFRGCAARIISPEPPFGFEGTTAWLKEIAIAAGRPEAAGQVTMREIKRFSTEMDSLKAAAAGHEMTFVSDASSFSRLMDPAGATGLAVLPVVAELGYRIVMLANEKDAALFRDFKDKMVSWADENGVNLQVRGFSGMDDLAEGIRSGRGGAVFSEYFYDYRISREGRPQFSARDFEIGYDGAVRTARRLRNIVNMPFYNRYSGFIAESAALAGTRNWWKS